MWIAGVGDAGGGFDGVGEVAELNPFAGLSVADPLRQTLASHEVPPRAYSVALGLAVRGLADA